MKNKKTIGAFTLSLFVASSSFAGQSCSDQLDLVIQQKKQSKTELMTFQKKDGSRTKDGTKIAGAFGGALVVAALANPATASLAFFGYAGALGVNHLSTLHASNMRKLFQEATDVVSGKEGGKSISKLYKQYLKKYSKGAQSDVAPFSLKQFATAIHSADLNGNACKAEIIPERNDVLRISLEPETPTVDKNANGIPDQLE